MKGTGLRLATAWQGIASAARGPVAAFALALLSIAAIVGFSSPDPAGALISFFARPFSSAWYLGNMLDMAGLLTLAGAGACLALRAGCLNLGGEAQLYAPALACAALLARLAPGASGALGATTGVIGSPAVAVALSLGAALAVGAALGFIPGFLRAKLGVSELLSSFLLSAALLPVADFLVAGPLRDATGNLVATAEIARAFRLPAIFPPSRLTASFPVAVAIAVLSWLFVSRTESGYRLRMTGAAPEFARYAGFPVARISALAMTVSASLHALAGFFAVTGTWHRCHQGFSAGMGWSALAVALVARGNALAAIPAALAFSWLETASDAAVLSAALPLDPTPLVQAIIFVVISARRLPLRRAP